ncbi:MAG: class II SORL domain-containing protein [Candidatus Auribacterota bacterium]|jgi:superoxide reductase|uniref:Neelaredoxin n=1 Tax=Candidatus Auribacter fodinae TaxID=2093366 RepID=A0A3A4R4H2_9BACT|nr:MAG: Neelaredoxin [Candidatus Auribacter fodinae]
MALSELYQSADWKAEKHAPVIEAPDSVKKGDFFNVNVSIGKAIAHPNKTEHHISWIEVFFHPDGEKFPYQIARAEFTAHGASPQGPDTSSVYTHHTATVSFKTEKAGTILASSYCNIHGLWQSDKKITVQ